MERWSYIDCCFVDGQINTTGVALDPFPQVNIASLRQLVTQVGSIALSTILPPIPSDMPMTLICM